MHAAHVHVMHQNLCIYSQKCGKKVWFKPGSVRFDNSEHCLSPELNHKFSSAHSLPNLGLKFCLVLKSPGSNFGSEPDCGIHTVETIWKWEHQMNS